MKILSLVLLVILLAVNCYAGILYEKVSDSVVKLTSTTEIVITNNKTIASLKQEKANLETQKTNALNSYNSQIASFDTQIADIDTQIAESVALGIIEIDSDGNIVP